MTKEQEEIVQGLRKVQAELASAICQVQELPVPALGMIEMTSHALRNYLFLVQGTASLLQKELKEYPIEDVQTWLDSLKRAGALMIQTIDQLEPSAVPVDPRIKWETVDLGRMVTRFCEHYRKAAASKSITLEYQLEATLTDVFTDRVMVASILETIFSNALKYTPLGKGIDVRLEDAPEAVVCLVHNEGQSLSPDERARLFEPGVRLSPKPTGNEVSRGYGLVVAKQLADRLGVKIWCASQPGEGCCFGVSVPRPDAFGKGAPEP
jgi:signal transduction histidine kinase